MLFTRSAIRLLAFNPSPQSKPSLKPHKHFDWSRLRHLMNNVDANLDPLYFVGLFLRGFQRPQHLKAQGLSVPTTGPSVSPRSGEEKAHRQKQIQRIVPGVGGWVVMCFWGVIPYQEKHKQNPTKIPGQSRECFVLLSEVSKRDWRGEGVGD